MAKRIRTDLALATRVSILASRASRCASALWMFALATGCGSEAARGRPLSGLALLDTISIRETDRQYLARPVSIAMSDRRGFFITDAFTKTVHQVDASGAMVQTVGRYGSGPGEYLAPVTLAVSNDSILLVADPHHGGVFERNLNTDVQSRLLPLGSAPLLMTAIGDSVIAGSWFRTRNKLFATWRAGDDSVTYFGSIPQRIRDSPPIQSHSHINLTAWMDTLLYHVGFDDYVYLAMRDGRVVDSILVPRTRRRGVPTNFDWTKPAPMNRLSLVVGLRRLDDGRLAIVHVDLTTSGRQAFSDAYVTLISREQGGACTDLTLPSAHVSILRTVFHGDTLVTLDQLLEGDTVRNVIRRYVFPDGTCQLQP